MPQGQEEEHMTVVWIMMGILFAGALIWWFGHTYVAMVFLYIKRIEIHILGFFTDRLNPMRIYVLGLDPNNVTFEEMSLISKEVGYYLRWPCAIILLILATILMNKESALKYKHTHTMQSLLKFQLPDWPACTPAAKVDLADQEIYVGPWAVAMQPLQFVKKYELVKIVQENVQDDQTLRKEAKKKTVLLKGKASKLFMLQLGELWPGVDKLSPHVAALYAAFAAKVARDGEASQKFLDKLSASSLHRLDFSGTAALLRKYKDHPEVIRITKSHAYTLTAMASMLEEARKDGVLSSASFLWLKLVDRRLWYMLNTVGRWTSVVEVAGPYAHWVAEKNLGRAIKTPMIEEATKALEEALREIIYTK